MDVGVRMCIMYESEKSPYHCRNLICVHYVYFFRADKLLLPPETTCRVYVSIISNLKRGGQILKPNIRQ